MSQDSKRRPSEDKTTKTAGCKITLRSERVAGLKFQRDERAALPRKPGIIDYLRIKTGAPEPIRSQLGQNIFISAFPYPQWLQGTGRPAWRNFHLVVIESERWRVTVCPDLGGRILGLFDKKIGRELLWLPPSFQFAPVGLPGAWLLGGIEFNAFRFGHSVHGMMSVRIEEVRLDDGRTGLRWGSVDELLECEVSILLVPLPDRVTAQITMKNHSRQPQPGYWWTNIAVPAKQGTQLLYRDGPVLHHGCDMGMTLERWPQLNGGDWSRWQNHDSIISAYWPEYDSDVFGYAAPGEQWAMVHHADQRMCRGRKLWSVGAGHDAEVWMGRCGEAWVESYCEIQSGRRPTQLEADLLEPGAELTWVESFSTVPWKSDNTFSNLEAAFKPVSNVGKVVSAKVLVEEESRLALSRKAVMAPQSLSPREIQKTTMDGWVGGAAWMRVLETQSPSEWRDLALGAARLDLGDTTAALKLLKPLAKKNGQAALVLGWHEYQQGNLDTAVSYLRQAVRRLPERAQLLHQILIETGRAAEAGKLWRGNSDAARYARAQVAFLQGRWNDARRELESPMPCIAEGSAAQWQLRKEVELAEASELVAAGRIEDAQNRLAAACQFLPQFGVGRFETTGNADIIFYRWLLTTRTNARLQADALASHLLRQRPFAGSVEAAYVFRLAKAVRDPSVPHRAASIQAWNNDAENTWPQIVPLRFAVLRAAKKNSATIWKPLLTHWLYGYRARFETALAAKSYPV